MVIRTVVLDGMIPDMASVPVCLPSNKVISRVSYPHGLSFLPNNSRYLFFCKFDDIKDKGLESLQFLSVCNRASLPVLVAEK